MSQQQQQNNFSAGFYQGPRAHDATPADMGWQLIGSNAQSRVEYYTNGNTRMDYYPTTGTIKTAMDHPSQGKTQMFRRDLGESDFARVCENPRAHTGHGYQRTGRK